MLHDTVEDTKTTFEELQQEFGEEVTQYVREATDDKSLPKVERKKLQIIHSTSISDGGKLIKYADKIANMGDLTTTVPCPFNPYEVAQGYMVWGMKVCEAFKGMNETMDKQFNDIIAKDLTFLRDGKEVKYPAIPNTDLDQFLVHYYDLIHNQK